MSLLKKLSFGKSTKNEPKPVGKLIVIDGTDGSGKTTQTKALVESLKNSDYPVETIDFPQYGTKSAGLIEEYLNGKYGGVNAYAASIFYSIDRFDASFKIKTWLSEGKIVIANRYVTANAGHQGGKIEDKVERIKYFKWLDNLEYNIFNVPKPDLNIILHVPAETAQKLVDNKDAKSREYANGKKRDMHEADINHLKNAEAAYLEIASLFPNTKLIECVEKGKLLDPNEVHNKVWELVRRIALKGILPKN